LIFDGGLPQTFSKSKFVENVIINNKTYKMYEQELSQGLNHIYILYDKENMVAGFEFNYNNPGLAQVKNVHVAPNYRKNGIGNFFYDYLISKNWMLYNDYRLTIESERIWNKLITKYPAKIFDKNTMAVYNFNRIGTKGSDGSIITLPEKDTSNDKNQRWFYVVGNNLP
jgi:hypothetical protein